MSTTPINILVDVPNIGNYNIEELQQKLKAYAQQLIKKCAVKNETEKSHHHSLSSLRGVGKTSASKESLLDEYMTEKYGV